MTKKKKKFYLIDGNAFCYRAYYSIKELSTSDGLPTNALYGFINILHKLIKENTPDMLTVVFDSPGPTKRHQKYEKYKIHRKPMPEDLVMQLPWIKDVVAAHNISMCEMRGYEADDIIATLAMRAKKKGLNVTIVTTDKDALQLVDEDIKVLSSHAFGNSVYGAAEVEKKYGVGPKLMVDLMALAGDSSDNIPGVKGIGKVTASKLISKFGSLRDLYRSLDLVSSPAVVKKLSEDREMAELSRELVALNRNVPVELDLDGAKIVEPDRKKLMELYRKFEFSKLLRDIIPEDVQVRKAHNDIKNSKDIDKFVCAAEKQKEVTFVLSTEAGEGASAGIAFSFRKTPAVFMPFTKRSIPKKIKELLENEDVKKVGYDIKEAKIKFRRMGIDLKGKAFDVMIADYLLDPAASAYKLSDIAIRHLGAASAEEDGNASASADRSRVISELHDKLSVMLKKKHLLTLFEDTEMPLVDVLAEMETNGVSVDIDCLKRQSGSLKKELKVITKKIYKISGEEFNINSPKQLQDVLYERLGLPVLKKTKTGFSTDESVLRKLVPYHELPQILLEYRELNKLKTGYYDSILQLASVDKGKVHAHFNQAVTSTGRLSSSEPNLQNIPIKTKKGKEIRRVFTASDKKNILLAADYSQVELRILAHLSGDKNLINAFKKDQDVHSLTAMEIFDTDDITGEMRSAAKTVNFGIIYGISSFGLAKELGINISEAQDFIDTYFENYAGVKKFISGIISNTKEKGYVTTLLNRRRYIPEINSTNERVRSFSERTAINTPVQGSAADLIKLAMIACWREFNGTPVKMIIQVHDELVFDVPKKIAEDTAKKIKKIMEGVMSLKVPLKVDMEKGENWLEMTPVE